MEFLDKEGVTTLWNKVKTKVQSVNKDFVGLSNVSNDAQVKRTEMGTASGVATLDSTGKIPVEQLGNLDTVVAMVVTELPTTDIKANKIYLVKDSTVAGDLYQEYLYVNGAWEKIGTHQSTVELSDYITKEEAVTEVAVGQSNGKLMISYFVNGEEYSVETAIATTKSDGAMSASDKAKLDSLSELDISAITSDELNTILV